MSCSADYSNIALAGFVLICWIAAAGLVISTYLRRRARSAMRTADAAAIERQANKLQTFTAADRLLAYAASQARRDAEFDFVRNWRHRANPYSVLQPQERASYSSAYNLRWKELQREVKP